MRRRKRRRRHTGLWLLAIGLIAIVAGTLFLIFRGAKVSGPDAEESASNRVIDTTPTATHAQAGTYTAKGDANDPDGEALSVRVYLRIQQNGHYRRELQIKGDSLRSIIDSGTYSGSAKTLKLTSSSAVVFTYHSAKAMRAQTPSTTSRYGGDDSSYPTYLTTVLNNRITLKKKVAQTYRYVHTTLDLKTSIHAIPTVSAAIAAHGDDTASTSSQASSSAATLEEDANRHSEATSSASTLDRSSATKATSSSADSSTDSSASSSASSSQPKLTVEAAQAIVAQQYPSTDYTITATGQSGDSFTFAVINNDTHDNQSVTVDADGQLQ